MKKVRSLMLLGILLAAPAAGVEFTWKYAVQISASVQSQPPQIHLTWLQDPFGSVSYTVYRKAVNAGSWDGGTVLPGSITNYTDNSVQLGEVYEYQVVRAATEGYQAFGYICAGIEAPLKESRGTLVLVVATNATASLSAELTRLKQDLIGDGWTVLRRDVSSNATPQSVKSEIVNCYLSDPANVNAVLLFGRVPIFKCGPTLNYDGHGARRMAADAYYGDMDGWWDDTTAYLPSDVELMVGRVDLADMPGMNSAAPWPNETELLRRYLNKNHEWRHGRIAVPRTALMGDRRGEEEGFASAATGFRNFEPLVGPGNIVMAGIENNTPNHERWISMAGSGSYLWGFGCGGGLNNPSGISQLGTHGEYHDVWAIDVVDFDARVVFSMFFGSWFAEWDGRDNFLRAFLATPTQGLASFMSGRPHWYLHHMGLGEPIGYSTRLSMNNDALYQHQMNEMTRAVYVALMGDPTLRMDPVGSPSNLAANTNGGIVTLSWAAPPGPVTGYHVYRAASAEGPFARLTASPIAGSGFIDATPIQNGTYMVRAIRLQQTPSGTYFNPSQGSFVSVTAVGTPQVPAPLVNARRNGSGLVLTWNSVAGATYRVQFKSSIAQTEWMNLSSPIPGSSESSSWTDPDLGATQRFYRVMVE